MICGLQRAIEVLCKWYIQILELGSQTFVEVIFALLGVEDGRLISVVPEMTSGNEAITTCICKLKRRDKVGVPFYRCCRAHTPPKCSFLCLADEHGRLSERSGWPVSGCYFARTCLGDGKASQFHQLIEGEGSNTHKVLIQRSSIFGIKSLIFIVSSWLRW